MTRAIVVSLTAISLVIVLSAATGRTFTARLAGFQVQVRPLPGQHEATTDLTTEPAPAIGAGSVIASTDQEQWAIDFLAARGIAEPAPESILFVIAWQQAEGTAAQFNPIATSEDMPGATLFNSDGVKNYATRADGITAAARTLDYQYAGYAEIAEGLARGDPDLALRGIQAGSWGSQAPTLASVYNELVEQYTSQAPTAIGGIVAGAGCKAPPTWPVNITAGFYDTESSAWNGQANGWHLGTDFGAPQGSPVYAPFDWHVLKIGYYDSEATRGWYIDGEIIPTGEKLYMGHLQNVTVAEGQDVACGQQVAEIGEYNHTHVRLAAPNTPVPCEQLTPGWGSGCVDFVAFYNSR